MFPVEINRFHTKKLIKWPYKAVFYAFKYFSLYKTENQSVWVFQSVRFIPPVPHTFAINVTEMTQFLLI